MVYRLSYGMDLGHLVKLCIYLIVHPLFFVAHNDLSNVAWELIL